MIRAALVTLVAGLVVSLIGFLLVRNYLHSEAFRQFLEGKVGAFAKVQGRFSPFKWEGLATRTDRFEGRGESLIRSLEIDGIRTEVSLAGLTRGYWDIRASHVRRISLDLNLQRENNGPDLPESKSKPGKRSGTWMPRDVMLEGLDVGELKLAIHSKAGTISSQDTALRCESAGPVGTYKARLEGGAVSLPFPWLKSAELGEAKLRYQDRVLHITSLDAVLADSGRLDASGEWDLRDKTLAIDGALSGLELETMLDETWARRMMGTFETDFHVSGPETNLVASGHASLQRGVLTALPVLDVLAAYADTNRFRTLHLNLAETDWRWKDGQLLLSDLVLSSEGLARLEGSVTISEKRIDGAFRLGLAPGTLASIPGAETDVFFPGEHGLLWAPLRVTGTLDDPKEDLSERLANAAGARLFEVIPQTGERVLKFTRSLLGEEPTRKVDKVIQKGTDILMENQDVIREAADLLDGFIGGGSQGK